MSKELICVLVAVSITLFLTVIADTPIHPRVVNIAIGSISGILIRKVLEN